MANTSSALQQSRENKKFDRDRANENVENSTLVKRFKIKKRPVIFDLSGTGATSNSSNRGR